MMNTQKTIFTIVALVAAVGLVAANFDIMKAFAQRNDESALYNKLLSVLRYLTGISGKRWDQYLTYGQELIRDAINKEKNKNKNDNGSIKSNDSTAAAATIASDYYEGYTDKMKNSPYAKLKGAPIDEFVANTRAYRKLLIEKDKTPVGDREILEKI
jgi:hypothetical protein